MDAASWERLARAVAYYERCGYVFVDAPWAVHRYAVSMTCPNPALVSDVRGLGTLVGSAEQSFLALELAGALAKGRYVAITPCFRVADRGDDLHHPYFMKVELYRNDLFDWGVDPQIGVEQMIEDARIFFQREMLAQRNPSIVCNVRTHEGQDLEINGIEVGSYGLREHGDLRWVCGTGLAEPRFSQAMSSNLTRSTVAGMDEK